MTGPEYGIGTHEYRLIKLLPIVAIHGIVAHQLHQAQFVIGGITEAGRIGHKRTTISLQYFRTFRHFAPTDFPIKFRAGKDRVLNTFFQCPRVFHLSNDV